MARPELGPTVALSTAREIHNESGPVLNATSLQVKEGMFLVDGFEAFGAGEDGAVWLDDAHLGGLLCLSPYGVQNRSQPQARFILPMFLPNRGGRANIDVILWYV